MCRCGQQLAERDTRGEAMPATFFAVPVRVAVCPGIGLPSHVCLIDWLSLRLRGFWRVAQHDDAGEPRNPTGMNSLPISTCMNQARILTVGVPSVIMPPSALQPPGRNSMVIW